jgi:hypothetical protein
VNADAMAAAVADAISAVATPLLNRIIGLERHVKALQDKPSLDYRGVWQRGAEYAVGHLVTDHGSLWICRAHRVASRPGDDSLSWRLVAKRGRDGRDGKDAGQ